MTSPNNNDIQQLRQQIDLLKWEKEIIKGRVTVHSKAFRDTEHFRAKLENLFLKMMN